MQELKKNISKVFEAHYSVFEETNVSQMVDTIEKRMVHKNVGIISVSGISSRVKSKIEDFQRMIK